MKNNSILQIDGVYKQFPVNRTLVDRLKRAPKQVVHALDGVSFSVDQGEILALVGESGSGKTTVGMNVLGLQVPTHGRITFDGYDVADWAAGRLKSGEKRDELGRLSPRKQILALRRRAQMVFQDPYESLNPRQTIREIVAEPLEIHNLGLSPEEKESCVRTALEDCGLAPAEHFWSRYPDELSGGQRQRVVVAGALVLEPELLVADEPVSMLDVSIRADILTLLGSLRKSRGITIIYTTHDLATAGYFTDRMAVMYLGRVVEIGPTVEILKEPRHPYTQALVSVAPVPNPRKRRKRVILQGEVPNPINVPKGCRFHPRCPIATDECKQIDPPYVEISKQHQVACLKV
ncbi:MAG TPA: ABC transporter ATP-binding protein [Anaerolineales bacterium]|nr:ABC transporter ATP-binding protein [Anaerolineales bacterium]